MAEKQSNYRRNHFVPIWYQKKFLEPGHHKLWRLDLSPIENHSKNHTWKSPTISQKSPKSCLFQDDLYSTTFQSFTNTDIEKYFFGELDRKAKFAIEHFSDFKFGKGSSEAFQALLPFMSTQKLRTPKGLISLGSLVDTDNRNEVLLAMQKLQNMFCATWTECVWQIADASNSPTKFIISDHPVVVYNREAFPASKYCTGTSDPDVRLIGTHTYFPLSLNKILIMTNLAWARDPYQDALSFRPNPKLFRRAIFSFMDIQLERFLTEEEVIQINFITKKRAHRFLVSSQKHWLFPERAIQSDHWRKLGDGYLLMPEPRHLHGGGETFIGYKGGHFDHFSEYGHRPWQKDYKDQDREDRESKAMQRFQAEWTAIFGKDYRALIWYNQDKKSARTMDDDYYKSMIEFDKNFRKLPGEKQRRRSLFRKKS